MKQIMSKLKETFDNHNLFFWLDAGTCLKAYRDSDIAGSRDIDIGIWLNDAEKFFEASNELYGLGVRTRYQGGLSWVQDMVTLHFPDKNSPPVDINMYERYHREVVRRNISHPVGYIGKFLFKWIFEVSLNPRDMWISDRHREYVVAASIALNPMRKPLLTTLLWLYGWCYTKWHVFPESCFIDFNKIDLYGMTFHIPTLIHTYLVYRYGDGWKTPDPEKKYRTDGNIFIQHRRYNRHKYIDKEGRMK